MVKTAKSLIGSHLIPTWSSWPIAVHPCPCVASAQHSCWWKRHWGPRSISSLPLLHFYWIYLPEELSWEGRRRETEAESQLCLASSHEQSARRSVNEPIRNRTEPAECLPLLDHIFGTQSGGIRSNWAHLTLWPDSTVNILKICELLCTSNLTLWNLGGYTNFLLCFLQKLEPSCKIGAYSATILGSFGIGNGHRWHFLCHNIGHYSRISCLQGGVEIQYWRGVCVLHYSRGVYSHYAIPKGTALAKIRGFVKL